MFDFFLSFLDPLFSDYSDDEGNGGAFAYFSDVFLGGLFGDGFDDSDSEDC